MDGYNIETGGPAFPVLKACDVDTRRGMDLRDYYAGKALEGLLARRQAGCAEEYAKLSYEMADAMIKARGY